MFDCKCAQGVLPITSEIANTVKENELLSLCNIMNDVLVTDVLASSLFEGGSTLRRRNEFKAECSLCAVRFISTFKV